MIRPLLVCISATSLLTFVACGGGGTTATPATAPAPYDSPDGMAEIDVQNLGENAVTAILENPLDADFDRTDANRMGQGWWAAFGKVKAMNAFGAMITYQWQAQFALTDYENRKWELTQLTMNNEEKYSNQEPLSRIYKSGSSPSEPPAPEPTFGERPPLAVVEKPEPPPPVIRTWTSGQFTIDAEFQGMIGSTVKLKRTDSGAVVSVPLDSLSEDDRKWIAERALK